MRYRTIVTVLVIVFTLVAIPVHAQKSPIHKGGWLFGGNGNFNFTNSSGELYEDMNGDGSSMLTFNLSGGYFIINGLNVGILVGYNSQSQGNYSSSDYTFGPRLAYFFQLGNPRLLPFLGAAYVLGGGSTDAGGTTSSDYSKTDLQLFGGVSFMVVRSVGITGAFLYHMDSRKPESGSSTSGNRVGVNIGFLLFL